MKKSAASFNAAPTPSSIAGNAAPPRNSLTPLASIESVLRDHLLDFLKMLGRDLADSVGPSRRGSKLLRGGPRRTALGGGLVAFRSRPRLPDFATCNRRTTGIGTTTSPAPP